MISRDSLKKNLSKSELQSMLEYNKQNVPPGEDRVCEIHMYLLIRL